jgi:pyrroloquinoline quinone (PQQ) biosynthesis protein C
LYATVYYVRGYERRRLMAVEIDVKKVQSRLGKELISSEEFEAFLDDYIRTKHPQINHPWVKMLMNGELTHDDLRVHALQFEHFLRFAPSHFLMMGANAEPHRIPDDDDMRRDAVQNLVEDMVAGPLPHLSEVLLRPGPHRG